MKSLRFKKLCFFLTASIALTLLVTKAYGGTVTVPTTCRFGYGTDAYFNFNTNQTFNTVYRENDYWHFDDYGFQVQNGNMTITDFFVYKNKLNYTITALNDTASTVKIYISGYTCKAVFLNGTRQTENVNWTCASNITTINATHYSATSDTICFLAAVFWEPQEIFTVNVELVAISVAGASGVILVWYWRRKKKKRSASTP